MKILISLFLLPLFAKSLYTFNDLSVLLTQKSYKEFLDHAQDIRPGSRNEKWQSMLEMGIVGRIQELIKKIPFEDLDDLGQLKKIYEEVYSYGKFPHVLENLDVSMAREEWIRKYYSHCLKVQKKNTLWCHQKLVVLWHQKPNPAQFGIELGQLAFDNNLQDSTILWEFFQQGYSSSMSNAYCSKTHIQEILFSKIKEMTLFEKVYQKLHMVDELINEICWSKLKEKVESMLYSSKWEERLIAMTLLKSKNQLQSDQEDFIYVSYLLDNPIPGDYFNWSWNRLEELSKNHLRRLAVLKKLKLMDPMLDTVFIHKEPETSKGIIKSFSENFPEYLDSYSKKCIDFFTGAGEFPQGNPTPNCRELFKLSEGKNWVGENFQETYRKIQRK